MPPGRDLQRDDVIGNGEHAKAMVLGQHNDGFLIVAPSGGNHSSSQRKIRRTAHSRFQHSSTIQRGRAVVSIGVLIPLGPFAWHGDDDTCFMRLLSLRPRWIFWCDALCSKESSTHNRNLSQARALSGRPKTPGASLRFCKISRTPVRQAIIDFFSGRPNTASLRHRRRILNASKNVDGQGVR